MEHELVILASHAPILDTGWKGTKMTCLNACTTITELVCRLALGCVQQSSHLRSYQCMLLDLSSTQTHTNNAAQSISSHDQAAMRRYTSRGYAASCAALDTLQNVMTTAPVHIRSSMLGRPAWSNRLATLRSGHVPRLSC
jgi:hypothetical protein